MIRKDTHFAAKAALLDALLPRDGAGCDIVTSLPSENPLAGLLAMLGGE